MDLAGFPHEGGATSVAVRGSNGGRNRRAGRPHGAPIRPESVHVVQSAPTTAVPADAPVDPVGAAPDTADQLQADYFVRMLSQNRRLSDRRIDEYRKAIATAEAKGDAEGARVFRRMLVGEEQDRQSIDGMIEGLRRRFARRAPAAV